MTVLAQAIIALVSTVVARRPCISCKHHSQHTSCAHTTFHRATFCLSVKGKGVPRPTQIRPCLLATAATAAPIAGTRPLSRAIALAGAVDGLVDGFDGGLRFPVGVELRLLHVSSVPLLRLPSRYILTSLPKSSYRFCAHACQHPMPSPRTIARLHDPAPAALTLLAIWLPILPATATATATTTTTTASLLSCVGNVKGYEQRPIVCGSVSGQLFAGAKEKRLKLRAGDTRFVTSELQQWPQSGTFHRASLGSQIRTHVRGTCEIRTCGMIVA